MSTPTLQTHLWRYVLILIAATIALNLGSVALASVTALQVPGGALAIFPPILAAHGAGRSWAQSEGVMPTDAQVWRLSLMAAAAYLAVQALLLPLALISAPAGRDVLGLSVLVLAGATGLAVLLHRVFLPIGARSALAQG
jgi:hypothetical protein